MKKHNQLNQQQEYELILDKKKYRISKGFKISILKIFKLLNKVTIFKSKKFGNKIKQENGEEKELVLEIKE